MYAKAGEMLPTLPLLPKTNHYKKLYHRKTQPTPNYPHSTYTYTHTDTCTRTRNYTHERTHSEGERLPIAAIWIWHIPHTYSIFHIFQCRLSRLTFQSVWWWQCCTRAPLTVTMNVHTVHWKKWQLCPVYISLYAFFICIIRTKISN